MFTTTGRNIPIVLSNNNIGTFSNSILRIPHISSEIYLSQIVFLMAGTLLATTAITTMVPSAYADNRQRAEDDSAAAIADCDDNDVEEAGFDCFGIAVNDVGVDIGGLIGGMVT